MTRVIIHDNHLSTGKRFHGHLRPDGHQAIIGSTAVGLVNFRLVVSNLWTGEVHDQSSNDYEKSYGRSKRRFLLILTTYFDIGENEQNMKAPYMLCGLFQMLSSISGGLGLKIVVARSQ
ncbi:hypothetical protein AVEN_94151-1 [Araneus ventricosus]|uniref:Uncharacterized protein n=1 Tax=Araneus ventricosus TaxID=182803 RepID=A0A4Y2N3B9_ARAVE|nr:hypothetical protein AVEN_94151-1 [Araneus ventricosus]